MSAHRTPEGSILLVEDNEHDIELTTRAFRKHNLANQLVIARDGAEALGMLFGSGGAAGFQLEILPRVVLLDLKLPKVSGLEVLGAIRTDPRTRSLPVVVLTTSVEEPDVRACYDLGVNSYIAKPVDFQSFVNAAAEIGLYWLLLNVSPTDRRSF